MSKGSHWLPGFGLGYINPLPPRELSNFPSCSSSSLSHQRSAHPHKYHQIFICKPSACYCSTLSSLIMTTLSEVCSSHQRRRRPVLADPLLSWSPKVIVIFTSATLTKASRPAWQCQYILLGHPSTINDFIHIRYVCTHRQSANNPLD